MSALSRMLTKVWFRFVFVFWVLFTAQFICDLLIWKLRTAQMRSSFRSSVGRLAQNEFTDISNLINHEQVRYVIKGGYLMQLTTAFSTARLNGSEHGKQALQWLFRMDTFQH